MVHDTALSAPGIEFGSKGNILVVDDDEFSRDLMFRRLTRSGFTVVTAEGGESALRFVDQQRFDLVLLDLVMPDIGGQDVLAAIRANFQPTELPVVMLTSKNDGDDIAESFRIGANDFVTKPFEYRALIARIETHIARHRAESVVRQVQEELERHVEERTTELRSANAELTETRNILTDALEAIDDGFAIWGRDDRLVACNQNFRELFGKNAGAAIPGVRFSELMRLQAQSGALRNANGRAEEWLAERLEQHNDPQRAVEEELADGGWIRVRETKSGSGRTVGLYTDITDIKRREIALKTFAATNRRLAAAVNATSSAILITDPRRPGNPTVFANPAFTAMTGWPVEEALGRNRKFLSGPETDPEALGEFDAAMRDGRSAKAELSLRARNGRRFWAEVSASPIRDNEGKVTNWVIIHSDITTRKETEEQLLQSQKMELIGQLTGGLAHDFNNLLTVVLGNLEFALASGAIRDDETDQHLKIALDAGRRGAELTKRMLAFARRQTLVPRNTDLGQMVSGFQEFLGRTLGESVGIRTDIVGNVWPVLVDRSQMENAILNLAVNARDAMPRGGTVTLRVGNRSPRGLVDAGGQEIPPGEYVCVSVTDTGEGMSPDVLSKAVQPFFTTKESGKGTGLGLSMVYGFATQSRGHMRIESAPGNGATIELYFPRAAEEVCDDRIRNNAPLDGGQERILLVDDEPQVRAIAAIQLRRLGYEVVQAEDGHEALDLLQSSGPIDLLVTDIGLPGGMTGLDLAGAVRERHPDMPVLYVSGYSDGSSSENAQRDPTALFLAKPYDRAALAAAVREALSGAATENDGSRSGE